MTGNQQDEEIWGDPKHLTDEELDDHIMKVSLQLDEMRRNNDKTIGMLTKEIDEAHQRVLESQAHYNGLFLKLEKAAKQCDYNYNRVFQRLHECRHERMLRQDAPMIERRLICQTCNKLRYN